MKKAIFLILALMITLSFTGCRRAASDGTVTAAPSPGMSSPTPYGGKSDAYGDNDGRVGKDLRDDLDDILDGNDGMRMSASPTPDASKAVE